MGVHCSAFPSLDTHERIEEMPLSVELRLAARMTQLQNHVEEEKDEVHARKRHREMQRDELCGLQISWRNYIRASLSLSLPGRLHCTARPPSLPSHRL